MLKLATVLDNPGEPQPETRYRDPKHLRALGYNGLVIYETTGLSGVDHPDTVGRGEMGRWVQRQFELVRDNIIRGRKAGLDVYISYDVLTLARAAVERDQARLVCKNRSTTLCPASEEALSRSVRALESLLAQWPDVQGVVLRFGDTDAARLPYLVGNDIYLPHCPRCSHLGRADRIALVLDQFHKLVVQRLNKRLIARAWNVRPNGMHDSVELCRRLRGRLPGEENDDRFILSFKFTEADFWRYQKWNPASLVFGRRPIIYELQCQREFEGKGGLPNWQVPLWRDGCPEMAGEASGYRPQATGEAGDSALVGRASRPTVETAAASPGGLAHLAGQVNLAGLWAWVRGGGWGGPFARNEAWIDANVIAVPLLADQPDTAPGVLADRWISERLRLTDPGANPGAAAAVLKQILEHSPEVILRGFYIGAFARARGGPWHPNGDWIQDDLVDVQAAWRLVERLPESELDGIVTEKQLAVQRLAEDRAALQHAVNDRNRGVLEPLVNSLIYGESLFSALRDLLAGLVAWRRFQQSGGGAESAKSSRHVGRSEGQSGGGGKGGDKAGGPSGGGGGGTPDAAALCRQRLLAAQSHWQQHTQHHASLPGAATAFRESQFWELTQKILSEVG